MVPRERDLFKPLVSADRLNPLFRLVMKGPGHAAARSMANAIFSNMRDVDGNFIKDFQTSGFSARTFELALFAYLEETDRELDRTQAAPDFVVRGDSPVAIEVTTTNPAQGVESAEDLPAPVPANLSMADSEFIFQLGKALRRKLQHRDANGRPYWGLPHITGLPFVIAVGAFHGPHAQFHPDGLLAEYLYGVRAVATHDEGGTLQVEAEHIQEHHFAGRSIPSALFRQPEAANLAGVIFSNAHTFSKFNRIGVEQGLGVSDSALLRFGTCYNYEPEAVEPKFFAYVVGDRPAALQETFEEGLHLFINPWSETPLSARALPRITTTELRNDDVLNTTFLSTFRPLVSKTLVVAGKNAYKVASERRLDLLSDRRSASRDADGIPAVDE